MSRTDEASKKEREGGQERGRQDRVGGMGAVFLAGFVAIFAVVFAAANALLGAGGGPSLSEESYRADPITQLAANGEAGLGLAAEPVARRQIEYPRGYAQVNVTSATVTLSGSKGINGVQRSTTENSVYCFDLTFAPRVAVASANTNNNAAVGTRCWGTTFPPVVRPASRMPPRPTGPMTRCFTATSTSASCSFRATCIRTGEGPGIQRESGSSYLPRRLGER